MGACGRGVARLRGSAEQVRIAHELKGMAGAVFRRESSPPRFSAGEKVPKADEGAVLALKLSVFISFHRPFMKIVHCFARAKAPSSAFGTFSPPLKNAVGRRTLDEHGVCDSNQVVRTPALRRPIELRSATKPRYRANARLRNL